MSRCVQDLLEGEAAPGISFAELAARRARLCEALPDHSLTLLPSAPQRFMTGVIPYPYRQDADFYYLTGLTQEGLAMFHKRTGLGARTCASGRPLVSIVVRDGAAMGAGICNLSWRYAVRRSVLVRAHHDP